MTLSREYELYRKMREKVNNARAEKKYALAEAILLQMEELWNKIPRDEQELLETCPPQALDIENQEEKS